MSANHERASPIPRAVIGPPNAGTLSSTRRCAFLRLHCVPDPPSSDTMIHAILVVNNYGKARLLKFYTPMVRHRVASRARLRADIDGAAAGRRATAARHEGSVLRHLKAPLVGVQLCGGRRVGARWRRGCVQSHDPCTPAVRRCGGRIRSWCTGIMPRCTLCLWLITPRASWASWISFRVRGARAGRPACDAPPSRAPLPSQCLWRRWTSALKTLQSWTSFSTARRFVGEPGCLAATLTPACACARSDPPHPGRDCVGRHGAGHQHEHHPGWSTGHGQARFVLVVVGHDQDQRPSTEHDVGLGRRRHLVILPSAGAVGRCCLHFHTIVQRTWGRVCAQWGADILYTSTHRMSVRCGTALATAPAPWYFVCSLAVLVSSGRLRSSPAIL